MRSWWFLWKAVEPGSSKLTAAKYSLDHVEALNPSTSRRVDQNGAGRNDGNELLVDHGLGPARERTMEGHSIRLRKQCFEARHPFMIRRRSDIAIAVSATSSGPYSGLLVKAMPASRSPATSILS